MGGGGGEGGSRCGEGDESAFQRRPPRGGVAFPISLSCGCPCEERRGGATWDTAREGGVIRSRREGLTNGGEKLRSDWQHFRWYGAQRSWARGREECGHTARMGADPGWPAEPLAEARPRRRARVGGTALSRATIRFSSARVLPGKDARKRSQLLIWALSSFPRHREREEKIRAHVGCGTPARGGGEGELANLRRIILLWFLHFLLVRHIVGQQSACHKLQSPRVSITLLSPFPPTPPPFPRFPSSRPLSRTRAHTCPRKGASGGADVSRCLRSSVR